MPDVPLDVERLCVEAIMSDFVLGKSTPPKQLPTVLWVCRRFKNWCYRQLYRSITFDSDYISTGLPLLRRTLVKSPELALLVQELTLPHRFRIQSIIEILPLCPNLVSLLVWNDEAIDLSYNKGLRRLSCFPTLFPALDGPLPPAFVQLTHLDLIVAEGTTWYWLFARLPRLTHLCTDLPKVDSDISCLIANFPPSLQVCVLFEEWPDGDDLARKKTIASGELDQRIVFAASEHFEVSVPYIYRQPDDLWSDWAKFGSGNTLWDEAELIIKSRRVATNEASSPIDVIKKR